MNEEALPPGAPADRARPPPDRLAPGDVEWLYATFLGRAPDSAEMVDHWCARGLDLRQAVELFMGSAEYRLTAALRATAELGDATLYHRTRHGFLFPVRLDDPLMLRSYVHYDYEAPESDAAARLLQPGDTAVDLGARHGWFTGLMAAKVGQSGRVYAVEPDPNTLALEALVRANDFLCVDVIRAAASDEAGTIRFDARDLTVGGSGDPVAAERLDDLLAARTASVRLMKIDIEGAEYRALKGAAAILAADRPVLLMEINEVHQRRVSGVGTEDVLDLLAGFGYAPHDLDDAEAAPADVAARAATGEVFNVLMYARP